MRLRRRVSRNPSGPTSVGQAATLRHGGERVEYSVRISERQEESDITAAGPKRRFPLLRDTTHQTHLEKERTPGLFLQPASLVVDLLAFNQANTRHGTVRVRAGDARVTSAKHGRPF
jgi:hypothetical protein